MNDVLPSDLPEFADRASANQRQLSETLRGSYDFIVCGAGSSGSVVARRLAENPAVTVLLIEAGGSDEVPTVMDPAAWPGNLGSVTDWGFVAEPNPHLNHRALPMSMGKVVGGGSSINVMLWARGHRSDWDFFAEQSGDETWGYDSVLQIFREIENWQGTPDPRYRGTGGPVFVQPSPSPGPAALAMLAAAKEIGIPTFESPNGEMMEGEGGCAITDILVRNGRRNSIFRAYTYPFLDRPNLTLLTGTQVSRILIEHGRAVGVVAERDGRPLRIGAAREVVLALGAIQTPAVLMRSGIGDENQLRAFDIPVVQHLPGVGQNLQDHVSFGCIWEYREPIAPRNTGNAATLYWKSHSALESPDLLFCQVEFPVPSPETAARAPSHGWTMFAGLALPKSRGRVRLRSAEPLALPRIEANMLSHPDDVKTAIACVDLCRTLGNTRAFEPLVARESVPGLQGAVEMERFVRDSAVTYWHQTCTAKMGRDAMSVVDSKLKVYGIDRLRIADGSVMPRITTGNTMAPCVIIGEKAARAMRSEHGI
ncbi:GMC family oxidoreductase N-terminal domain-containing protein [Bradyrhizobium sp. NBAIM20]|uniref:GMC family oxidoreductase n=1 Tax=unclassified Bradyrhizobium TaxID=2631580 RepID=UPI001CD2E433|nr:MULTISPECIES: GMC family oxidoreductase N-terminal domain-containing protein [unclassified Bradyrhizobium]MCA1415572.1 GMC family oxidoreductase N-terminal domain-containing protein [Bradyrhizobium sp. NBAIM20]MCA1465723.1 GMC family oxidoreductase N-terminal domain-containing protein [Bradyrhizobium sp. NBAIM18]